MSLRLRASAKRSRVRPGSDSSRYSTNVTRNDGTVAPNGSGQTYAHTYARIAPTAHEPTAIQLTPPVYQYRPPVGRRMSGS